MTQTLACRDFEEMAFVERYLLKRLSPAEQEEFEVHFLTCESCQQAIALGSAIRGTLPSVRAVPARRSWVTLGAGLGLAAAAGLAAVLLLPSTRPSAELTQLGAVGQAPLYLGVPVRADQPASADSLFGKAMAAYGSEDYTEAAPALRAALRAGVDSAPAEFFLAASVLMHGDAEQAEAGFARVIALGDTPYRLEAYFYRAKALLRLGRTTDALADLQSAAALEGVVATHARALADSVQRVAR
jgi:tetratricopeptide (TPR) repeat protein